MHRAVPPQQDGDPPGAGEDGTARWQAEAVTSEPGRDLLGLVAASWPARRAAKLDVLAAIAAD